MIIFGTHSAVIASEKIADKCPHCGMENTMQMDVIQEYFHIFYLPVFPAGRPANVQCNHCKLVIEGRNFTRSMVDAYRILNQNTKTKRSMYAGLWLIGGGMILVFSIITYGSVTDKKFISDPQKGDIYDMRLSTDQYTLYKVERVSGDSVFLRINQFETDNLSGLSSLLRHHKFSFDQDEYLFTKAELVMMEDENKILSVHRD